MRALFDFTERSELRELVGLVTEYRSVQGIVIDYDPLWTALWRVKCAVGDRAFDQFIFNLFDYWPIGLRSLWPLELLDAGTGEFEPPDPSWIPPHWQEIQRHAGRERAYKEPFFVKICLFPQQPNESLPELANYTFPVVMERRAPAELAMPLRHHRPVVGGVSIGHGPKESGTLGGVVEDQSKTRWGVTCAHVLHGIVPVDQPAQCDSSSAAGMGSGRFISVLHSSSANTPCNPYKSSATLNTVDAGLIELSTGVHADLRILQHGALSGITNKSSLNPGQLVEMAGKQSGSRILEIGGLALTYRLRDSSGNLYCFGELFELRWPRWWRVVGGRPVQRGDSGAWILSTQTAGTEWVGMALAGDRLVGYATFAENIADWAKNDHALDIRVR